MLCLSYHLKCPYAAKSAVFRVLIVRGEAGSGKRTVSREAAVDAASSGEVFGSGKGIPPVVVALACHELTDDEFMPVCVSLLNRHATPIY